MFKHLAADNYRSHLNLSKVRRRISFVRNDLKGLHWPCNWRGEKKALGMKFQMQSADHPTSLCGLFFFSFQLCVVCWLLFYRMDILLFCKSRVMVNFPL